MDVVIVSRPVEGGLAIIPHRVNGSACSEQQVRDGRILMPTRIVEGVRAITLQGQFVVKAREKVETRGVSFLEERNGRPQLFWEPKSRISY